MRNKVITLLVILYLSLSCANAQTLIVSKDFPLYNLTDSQLELLFTTRMRTVEGRSVKIYILQSSDPVFKSFMKNYLNISNQEFHRIVRNEQHSGRSLGPEVVGSISEMIKKVGESKRAIGFIDEPIKYHPNIRIMRVEDLK